MAVFNNFIMFGMADVFTVQKRSEVMSRIRSKGTVAEKLVFRYLRQQKVYFQKHYRRAPGKPDIALPRKKRAVFIDGDFWHGKTYDKVLQNRPSGDYWVTKIKRNMEREVANMQALEQQDWAVLRVWEDDIKRLSTRRQTLEQIRAFLATTA